MTVLITTNKHSIAGCFHESWGINNLFILIDYVILISNYFIFFKSIFKCSSICLTCNGSGCLSCITTLFLYNKTCLSDCPERTFVTSVNVCTACNVSCKTCATLSKKYSFLMSILMIFSLTYQGTNCTSCASPYFLKESTCIDSCPVKYWADISMNICKNCDSTCFSCVSPGNSFSVIHCFTLTIFMLLGTSSSCTTCSGTLYLYNSQCLSTCPDGTFKLAGSFFNVYEMIWFY
jgi:proprotein convertase subtilisin/kexin type 5